MLTSLELENYRGFQRYRLGELRRVNLLVGKNNCGKTSVLEAIHLLAAGGDPDVLAYSAAQRGEEVSVVRNGDPQRHPDITHIFHGHELGRGSFFSIDADNGLGGLKVQIVTIDDLVSDEQRNRLPDAAKDEQAPFVVHFEGARHPAATRGLPYVVFANGAINIAVFRGQQVTSSIDTGTLPVQMISPSSLDPHSMSNMWNEVIVEARESDVIAAMRIIEPGIRSLFFLSGEAAYHRGDRGGILVGFEGAKRRVPLGSHGEGMRRLLAISLSLIQNEHGILLIDEIDTGLHYSIMGNMWLLVVKAAVQANVQVFATTHSSDCVRGLAWLCENHPELGEQVSLQKIDPTLAQSVDFNAEQIKIASEQDIEVR